MSSDPFVDLARGVGSLAESLIVLFNRNGPPTPGSPADKEADGEPYAGKWSKHPSRDVVATMVLASWSCIDHMRALAAVLESRRSMAALYTLARAVAEAAVVPCYLSEMDIDPLERVRRNMNYHLEGICQDLNMLGKFTSAEAKQKVTRHEAHMAAIKCTGEQYGFAFKDRDRHRSAYLGDPPKSAMKLIDECAAQTQGVGALSYQMFCGVAHARLHGLSRFMSTEGMPAPDQPGKVRFEMNISARDLAQQLFAAPMCVLTLIEQLRWFLGWSMEDVDKAAILMENIWCRIAGVPYEGRLLRSDAAIQESCTPSASPVRHVPGEAIS